MRVEAAGCVFDDPAIAVGLRPVAAVESVTLKGQGKAASTYRATVNGTAYTFRDYVKVPGKLGRPKGSKNKPKAEAVAA